ncbi:hypothetical protein BV25DRAFT_1824049 [Artomyces pyxidatus]|uniref:Uncharacterized protein n=1 Tax=Artomyces pyxidatus TaxID=48021 RepID=A0ACB8T5W1_9AGAM|nr:hypothetical protein BV25DRAFT_1824049 [Artomyces pyxidatus]
MTLSDKPPAPVRKRRVVVPRFKLDLPHDTYTSPLMHIYGICVSEDWLVQYAKSFVSEEVAASKPVLSLMRGAIDVLKLKTGIKQLEIYSARFDDTVPSDTWAYGGVSIPVIGICTDLRYSYEHRPSQKQVDKLAEIMGKKPRWWTDIFEPEHYI